ncbi:MAG: type II toxin-antitoxin system VapC family toxin [Actinomycetota bacterium]
MRLLLDSHVVLWWLDDAGELGPGAREAIASGDSVAVSAVTPWELGIKRALGKLDHPDGLVDTIAAAGFDLLSISARHAERAPELPLHHRDPFDRMLVAQAQADSFVLVTADEQLARYEVELLDATS